MADPNITFPVRPMQVSPPGSGVFSQLGAVLWAAGMAAVALWVVISPIPDLVSDFAVRGAARPIADATIEGRCSVHLVLTSCEATLSARRQGLPDLRRNVDYWFVDFHFGEYAATVVADPAQPEKMTTDLALNMLWNRTATLLLLGPFFLWLGFFIVTLTSRALRGRRAVLRALSNQILRPTILRLDSWSNYTWTVSSLTSEGDGESVEWQTKGTPIFMDQAQNLVLGVTAGDGTKCMPLDTTLSWIDLVDTERACLLEQLGPERLRARSAAAPVRVALRRFAPWLTTFALVFAAAAVAAAWLAFRDAGPSYFTEVILIAVCGGIAIPLFLLAMIGYSNRKVA